MPLTKINFNQIKGAVVNVRDYGAVGTAVPSNVTVDTTAFLAALAAADTVYVPDGTYYISTSLSLGAGQTLYGDNWARTIINYTGTGSQAIFCGNATTDTSSITLRDFSLSCTNTAIVDGTFAGIRLSHCQYFTIDNVASTGPYAVYGGDTLGCYGFHLTKNTIIGRINAIRSNIWKYGVFFEATPTQSDWAAAIVVDGQSEIARCSVGLVIGNPTVNLYEGSIAIRNCTFQECYSAGIINNSGVSTVIDNCYFEGNSNYDLIMGATSGTGAPQPQDCCIINNAMSAGTQLGGTAPNLITAYLAKILIKQGTLNKIRDNSMLISDIVGVGQPLIIVNSGVTSTSISGNHFNTSLPTSQAITDNGTGTRIYQNDIATVAVPFYNAASAAFTSGLQNSWAQTAASDTFGLKWFDPNFNGLGTAEVQMQGYIDTGASSSVICTLNGGFRPTETLYFACSGSTATVALISVASNGVVTCVNKGTNSSISLRNVRFVAAQ